MIIFNANENNQAYLNTETIIYFFMKQKRPTVKDPELLSTVLDGLKDGEHLISEFYSIANPPRIDDLFGKFLAAGDVTTRMKDSGQRRPLYSLTDKGRLLLIIDDIHRRLLLSDSGIDVETLSEQLDTFFQSSDDSEE